MKIPQPDSKRRHSPDFRTVFGIMIGPFSSCEIGKTWGTNKQVNKQTNKNWKFQFPQLDYWPRQSPDFRTVFGIMIGPFSSCKIGKMWGTNKQVNKQTNKNWKFQFHNQIWNHVTAMNKFCITHFVVKSFLLLPNLNFHRYVKWEKALYKVRKSEKITFQWSKVSRLLTTITSHRPDFNTGLRFSFRAPEVPVLRVRKSHFHCFSSLQKSHFRCPKQKSETCSVINSVTWYSGK